MQREKHDGIHLHSSCVGEGIRNRLLDILHDDFLRFRRDPDMGEMILHMSFLPPDEQLYFLSSEMKRRRAIITRVFQEAIESGELRGDPNRLATIMIGISTMAILEHVLIEKHALTRRNAGKFVDILLRGAQPTGKSGKNR